MSRLCAAEVAEVVAGTAAHRVAIAAGVDRCAGGGALTEGPGGALLQYGISRPLYVDDSHACVLERLAFLSAVVALSVGGGGAAGVARQ